jgi:hypothetical protein
MTLARAMMILVAAGATLPFSLALDLWLALGYGNYNLHGGSAAPQPWFLEPLLYGVPILSMLLVVFLMSVNGGLPTRDIDNADP